jgi:hypothetical protein
MNLTLAQKAELDALVNFFGGSDNILATYKRDLTFRCLKARGLIRWAKPDKPYGRTFVKLIATKLGTTVANRFKQPWSAVYSMQHPVEQE